MQPIKFEPLLKQTLWGGDKIVPFKHLDSQLENVGESWEISGVKDNETSSLSMHVRICPYRYTPPTRLPTSKVSPAARRRCGI